MSLSDLTLSAPSGVLGRPFSADIGDATDGSTIDVVQGFTPGFSVVNGRLEHQGLPYGANTVVLRETLPGTGTHDTSIEIPAYSFDNPEPLPDGTATLEDAATVSVTNSAGDDAHDATAAVTGNTIDGLALPDATAMVDDGQVLTVPVTGSYTDTATVSVTDGVVDGITLS